MAPRTIRTIVAKTVWLALPLLSALLAGGCAAAPSESGPLADYPSSAALASLKLLHKEAASDGDQRALLTTWFVDGDPNVAECSSVLPDGHVTSHRVFFDSAITPNPRRDLSMQQLSELKQALSQLPPSQAPSLHDLLIVSFRNYATGDWVTRKYDRFHRPAEVSALFAITGAPIDPAPVEPSLSAPAPPAP